MSKYPGRIVTDLAPAGYSVYFDGSGDYLTVPSNSAFGFGTGDFTVEGWYFFTGTIGTYQRPWWFGDDNDNAEISSSVIRVGGASQGTLITGTTTLVANRWYHIALTRASGTYRLWLNGVQEGSSATNSYNSSARTLGIAATTAGANPITGNISNFRVVKGTALYTAAFTPPTQLFNITNTSLLTCNSPAIIDQSNNAFTITVNGNAAVSTLTPFTAYVPYNPALGAATPGVWTVDEAMQAAATRQWNMYDPYFNLTTLLLHGNGANTAQNNTFLDSSSNNFTITRNGNTTQGSFSPFSQTGWSNFFDGSGDNLQMSANAAFSFGTSDFTIECWFYSVTLNTLAGGGDGIFTAIGSVGIYVASNGVRVTQSGVAVLSDISTTINTNNWYHLALTRSGTNMRVFLNGAQVGSTITNSTNFSNTSTVRIGTETSEDFHGYISNLRILKGTAQYTSTFSPPTSPLTAITNTSLLTCQSNRFVDNSTNAFAITVNGTPFVQTFSPFYPTAAYTPQTVGGSAYFATTNDFLSYTPGAAQAFGTGDFTVECWIYTATSAANIMQSSSQTNSWGFLTFSNQLYWQWNGGNLFSGGTVQQNSWVHLAVSRTSGSTSGYVNGTRVFGGTANNDTNNYSGTPTRYIGPSGGGGVPFYVSGARIIKGTGLYSGASITVPTAPFTAVTNTAVLVNFTNAGIIDSTADNVLETVGNAQISTTQSKFGGSSMYFDGTGDDLLLPSSPIRALGTADFTIEFWFNASSIPTFAAIIDMRNPNTDNAGFDIMFYFNKLAFGTATFTYITGVTTLSTGTWYHYALTRSGNVFRQFLNGVQEGSTYTGSSTQNFTNTILRIANGSNGPYTGYLDDIRITRGAARYTGNFTPQTSQWQDQ